MLRKKIDEMLDCYSDKELEEIYWAIHYYHNAFLFRKNLQDKGVSLSEYDDPQEIMDLWDNTFAHQISEAVKKSIYYEQFRWHIFSYEKQSCMKNDEARKAFDFVEKNEVFIMYQKSPTVLLCKNAQQLVSTDFDSEQDVYVFDTDATWTYVHTHEEMCGPYFYQVKSK